jgi:hypothetical protein
MGNIATFKAAAGAASAGWGRLIGGERNYHLIGNA